VLLLVPAIPLCAVLLYQLLGANELIEVLQRAKVSQPEPARASTGEAPAHSLDEMAAQLAERMRSDPDNLQGWVMLVKTYNVLRRPDDAVKAYENVVRLGGGNDPNVLADYADTLVMANGGVFTDESGELLLRALELQPDHVKALWLAGHWKNDQREYAEAISYWQQAAAKMPADSKDAAVIDQQIRQAQTRLGSDQATTPAAGTQTAGAAAPEKSATGKSITVHVALDPQINTSAAPEDTVFIFARATQGPRMPLAIVRKQVKDLPVTVTLDDSMAMTPQMMLSKFARVTVGARISKSGNAMPASGDLQGLVTPVATQSGEVVQLTIDSKVP
jgi:cytochrome c-type biogenesis protein CcmH